MNNLVTWPVVAVVSATVVASVLLGIFAIPSVSATAIPILLLLATNSVVNSINQVNAEKKIDTAIEKVAVVQEKVVTVADTVAVVQNQSTSNGETLAVATEKIDAVHGVVNSRDTAMHVEMDKLRKQGEELRVLVADLKREKERDHATIVSERATAEIAIAAAVAAPAQPITDQLDRRTESERGE